MKAAILYYNFLDASATERKIGGVETYLWNLGRLIAERGDEPLLLQPAARAFEKQIEHMKIIGVQPNRRRLRRHIRKDLYEHALSLLDSERDIIIFGADNVSVRTQYPKCVSIQHGVCWDLPVRFLRGGMTGKFLTPMLQKRWVVFRAKRNFTNCRNRVCVDYNFLNWYRTHTADEPEGNTWVIPNFVSIPPDFAAPLPRPWHQPVKIIFARRFVEFRGSRLMATVVERLLTRHRDIQVVFAGEGPDEDRLTKQFAGEPRVSITKYGADDALQVHLQYDIAVVPSLASEGTSLSLAESMAAGCAVVATNVGGMTNMVIDGYNGRLVSPKVEDLYQALEDLITHPEKRLRLGQRASDTARNAFSLQRWQRSWREVLDAVERNGHAGLHTNGAGNCQPEEN